MICKLFVCVCLFADWANVLAIYAGTFYPYTYTPK